MTAPTVRSWSALWSTDHGPGMINGGPPSTTPSTISLTDLPIDQFPTAPVLNFEQAMTIDFAEWSDRP
ncbi:hypothetical protein [Limnothrix sp. PR1529]|uniref:hypothetical protein n=1 Tax=Limnothrix sp. PR1529 TaxID=1704291 RepID=UPI001303FE61|nr:hypothetical protein [Limnothrix sp. PR1529]